MTTRIKLHRNQAKVFKDVFVDKKHRYTVVNTSRGFGKSYLGAACTLNAAYELMDLDDSVPNKDVYVVAPSFDQTTDIYYPLMAYEFGLEGIAEKSSRDRGLFVMPGNVNIRLLSYEAVERMRGKGAYWVLGDEVSSWKKGIKPQEAWPSVIQPTLTTRWSPERAKAYGAPSPGRAMFISTPKGYNYFHELYNMREVDNQWGSYTFDYTCSPYLDPEEIERLRHSMDPIQFASEYLASFADSGVNVFYMFNRVEHVRSDLPDIHEGETIHAFIDFNVGIQATSLGVIRGNELHIMNEFKGHPDTEQLAKSLRELGQRGNHRIVAYPDPSGRARKTSAPVGRTDFSILESHGITCVARRKAPPIVDSVACVNSKLKNAAGEIGMYVHPRCKGTVMSLERTRWVDRNPDTATIDKSEGIEHFSDGIRYGMEILFPIANFRTSAYRGQAF